MASGDELDQDSSQSLSYTSWSRDLPGLRSRSRGHLSRGASTDNDLEGSVEGSSIYSAASTSDSLTSAGGMSDVLDCQKLGKLINQPTNVQGRHVQLVHYKPKRHMRYWNALAKKKVCPV